MITAKLSSKNQAVVPAAVRQHLGIGPGDEISFEIDGNVVHLRKVARPRIPRYDIDELLDAMTPETLPDEIFDDGPMGKELI